MIARLPLDDAGGHAALLAALAIGVAFGWCLERSGLGSARKLMGQFQLTDLAVFKVMFSAIVTAMLGLFWLSWLGMIDLSRVYLPDTFLLPQLAGGVIFGAGMALAGLCPGTSCVAAATGRIDGMAVVGGFFAGVLGTALLLPAIQRYYVSTPRGGYTLPTLLGVPTGVVVCGIVAMALGGFVVAERIERGNVSGGYVSSRIQRRTLAAIAGALGMVAALVGTAPPSRSPGAAEAAVSARQLAEWIRAGRPGLRVLDVRSDSAFDAYHIPSAERVSLTEPGSHAPAADETLVLYADGDAAAMRALATLRARGHERVYVLHGGLLGWMSDVMNPVVAGDSAARVAALSRYFGGLPRRAIEEQRAAPDAREREASRAPSSQPARAASVVDDLVRRGC